MTDDGGSAATGDMPTRFADVLAISGLMCHRCGESVTHRARLQINEKRTGGPGSGKTVASHSSDMCERCAVQLFTSVRRAMR